MVLRVDYLIYFYILLCVCMLIFNLSYMGRSRWLEKSNPKRLALWKQVILSDPKEMEHVGTYRRIRRKLSQVTHFITFHEAAQSLLAEDGKDRAVKKWFSDNTALFVELGNVYKKKSSMEKSFYAFIIGSYSLCAEKKEDLLINDMLLFTLEPSIYCRENALYALYNSGKTDLVVRALILMNRHHILHSRKLITDGLLSFTGNKEALAEDLWRNWEFFTPHYQIAIVDYIRMVSPRFGRRFLPILSSETDREVKFAIIRYYRKYRYYDAEKMLRHYVNNWCIDDWEFAAISASALENYPGEKTIRALLWGIKGDNWYVRNNSADTLLKITSGERQQKILNEMTDSFGRDMLKYKMDSLKKKTEIAKEREKEGDKI